MVKKKSKKGVIPRQPKKDKPPKVGGRTEISGKPNWSRVGRRRLEDNDVIRSLADALKARREEKGTTVAQIAKHLDIAPATVIKFEERSYPVSVKVISAMAEFLDCSLEIKPKKTARKKKKKK